MQTADPKFWDDIAEKYAARPVDDPRAFERKKSITRAHLMRWFGKAPVVHSYDRPTILRELREVGFVEVAELPVGAQKIVAFILGKKPGASARASADANHDTEAPV